MLQSWQEVMKEIEHAEEEENVEAENWRKHQKKRKGEHYAKWGWL